MAALNIHTGLNGGESAAYIPKSQWKELAEARSVVCNSRLRENCRSLVFFIEDASKNEWLGYGSFEGYVREGLTLDVEIVEWALDGLKKLDGEHAVTLDVAVKAGREERRKQSVQKVKEEGKSIRQAAREIGCDHTTVMNDLKVVEKPVPEQKKPPPKKSRQRLKSVEFYMPAEASIAAQKIRAKFGDDFAAALAAEILKFVKEECSATDQNNQT